MVTCRDLFYNHPVRRSILRRNLSKQVEDCRARLFRLVLIHPTVGITLMDAGSRRQLLRTPPGRSLLSALSDGFGMVTASSLMPVSRTAGLFTIRGYVTPHHISLPSPELQYFYVNRRFVRRTLLHKALSRSFAHGCTSASPIGSGAGAALNLPPLGHPGYVLCLECPPSAYDVTYDVEKTLIEFRDWETPLNLLHELLEEVWPRHRPFSPRADSQTPRASPITPALNSTFPQAAGPSRSPSPIVATGEVSRVPLAHHLGTANALSPPSPPHDFGLDVIILNNASADKDERSGLEDSPPPFRTSSSPNDDDEFHKPYIENKSNSNMMNVDEWSKWRFSQGNGSQGCLCCPPVAHCERHVGTSRRLPQIASAVAVDDEFDRVLCQPIEPFGDASLPSSLASPFPGQEERQSGGAEFTAKTMAEGFGKGGAQVGGRVHDVLATWKNPVFASPESGRTENLGVTTMLPKAEMSREVLDDARVVAEWGKKFILAMSAAGDLFAVDQHAADERVILEKLRGVLLTPPKHGHLAKGKQLHPSLIPTTVLRHPQRCQLSSSELAMLRANASLVWRWGWRWEDNLTLREAAGLAEGQVSHDPINQGSESYLGDVGVRLTGLPTVEGTVLGAEALAEFLREIIDIGVTSAPPPALHRLLASKACRGAIMFGDELSNDDCAVLLKCLNHTQLPLHCAHGRPTAVMLAPSTVAAANDDGCTPTKRRRILTQRARTEWAVIRKMLERHSSQY